MISPKRLVGIREVVVGLLAAAVFVLLGTYFFAYSLETLDVKAEQLGVEGHTLLHVPFPEYTVPGIESDTVNLVLGLASTLLIYLVGYGAAKLITSNNPGTRGAAK